MEVAWNPSRAKQAMAAERMRRRCSALRSAGAPGGGEAVWGEVGGDAIFAAVSGSGGAPWRQDVSERSFTFNKLLVPFHLIRQE